jgi:hypothetical protein
MFTATRSEGFWRNTHNPELPWPEPDPTWDGRDVFLRALDGVERGARRVAFRGYSPCRICGCQNGFQTLETGDWMWPQGYRHYIAEHAVRPSAAFEDFILTYLPK